MRFYIHLDDEHPLWSQYVLSISTRFEPVVSDDLCGFSFTAKYKSILYALSDMNYSRIVSSLFDNSF